jgi:hypothetical protein
VFTLTLLVILIYELLLIAYLWEIHDIDYICTWTELEIECIQAQVIEFYLALLMDFNLYFFIGLLLVNEF